MKKLLLLIISVILSINVVDAIEVTDFESLKNAFLNSGEITGNFAAHGGGVDDFAAYGVEINSIEFIMKSGKLDNNRALVSGGLYVSRSEGSEGYENVRILGGTINNNHADHQGGGIGTNGNIVIGTTPDPNNPTSGEYKLEIEKFKMEIFQMTKRKLKFN